jgi:hypothetical protein
MTGFPTISTRTTRLAVLAIWLLGAAVMIWSDWDRIGALNLRDTDDALRLVEVRAWIAGQSWFDVSQHRIYPPLGGPMHWSRLVDLPIAAFITLFSLVATPANAERLALVATPLMTLGLLFAVVTTMTRRMTGNGLAVIAAAAMLITSLGVILQYYPLRIDHHGWQIVLGLLAASILLGGDETGARGARRGMASGAVGAVAVVIGLEGLPLVVTIGGVFGLRYLMRPAAAGGVLGYCAALTLMSGMLMLGLLGWPAASVLWCDAMSPAFLVPIAVATQVLAAALRLVPQALHWQRLLCLALAGGAGAVAYGTFSHQCLAGPFAMIDPLVYKLWYKNVAEGLPIWAQRDQSVRIIVPVPAIIGFIGTALAIRFDAAERRPRWIELLLLQIATFLFSMFVMRSMGLAHVMALPGSSFLLLTAAVAALRLRTPLGRVMMTVGCVLLTPIGAEAMVTAVLPEGSQAPAARPRDAAAAVPSAVCMGDESLRGLNALPVAVLFAPLDIGPDLLVHTRHGVIATGHHRNVRGMREVVRALVASPADAQAIVAATPATYVVYCPGEYDIGKYATLYPGSFSDMLSQGRVPGWLAPVQMRHGESIRVFRIER